MMNRMQLRATVVTAGFVAALSGQAVLAPAALAAELAAAGNQAPAATLPTGDDAGADTDTESTDGGQPGVTEEGAEIGDGVSSYDVDPEPASGADEAAPAREPATADPADSSTLPDLPEAGVVIDGYYYAESAVTSDGWTIRWTSGNPHPKAIISGSPTARFDATHVVKSAPSLILSAPTDVFFEEVKFVDVDLSNLSTMREFMADRCFKYVKTVTFENMQGARPTSLQNAFSDIRASSLDLSWIDASRVESMYSAFAGNRNLRHLILPSFEGNPGLVTDMSWAFSGCSKLSSLDLAGLDTSNVTDFSNCFGSCEYLADIDLASLDVSSAVDISSMFDRCLNLNLQGIEGWDVSHVSDFNRAFYMTGTTPELDLSGWDMRSATNLTNMFCASGVISLDLSGWELPAIWHAWNLVDQCASLKRLDLSGWNIYEAGLENDNVLDGMLRGLTSLEYLNLDGFTLPTSYRGMNKVFDDKLGAEAENLCIVLPQGALSKKFVDSFPGFGTSWTKDGATVRTVEQMGKLSSKKLGGAWYRAPYTAHRIDISGVEAPVTGEPLKANTKGIKASVGATDVDGARFQLPVAEIGWEGVEIHGVEAAIAEAGTDYTLQLTFKLPAGVKLASEGLFGMLDGTKECTVRDIGDGTATLTYTFQAGNGSAPEDPAQPGTGEESADGMSQRVSSSQSAAKKASVKKTTRGPMPATGDDQMLPVLGLGAAGAAIVAIAAWIKLRARK